MGQELLGPSYFFIPVVLGPLNSLVWYDRAVRRVSVSGRHASSGAPPRHDRLARHAGLCSPQQKLALSSLLILGSWRMLATLEQETTTALRLKGTRDMVYWA